MIKHLIRGALISLVTTVGIAPVVQGHAIQTDYLVDLLAPTPELSFQASYSTGEPVGEATVLVYAPGDPETPWLEGTTDTAGTFRFVPDETLTGDWRLEFIQAGHQDILIVPVAADGIDYVNISQVGAADVHYAELNAVTIALLSAIGLGVLGSTLWKLRD